MAIFAQFTGRPRFSTAENPSQKRKLPSLAALCRKRDFHTIATLLQDKEAPIERKWLEQEYSLMGENSLHFIMRFNPPANVIVAMIERLRVAGIDQAEITVDLLGRTALHHACAAQCEPAVIHTLLRSPAGAISARAQDLQGRLPLHLLCKSYQPSRKRSQKAQAQDEAALSSMTVGIKLLVALSPRTACVKDDKGRVPLEYVKQMKVDNKKNPTAAELWESMKTELRIAMDLSTSTAATCFSSNNKNIDKSGMVIKFSDTTLSDDDDVSVLSFSGGV